MKVLIARPSDNRMRGPKVLKIRTIAVSVPSSLRYAAVRASAYRLASVWAEPGPTGSTAPQ
jgi:hypothetical protein